MKFKTGDEARVKRTNKETMYKHIEGTTVLILNNVCGDLYKVIDCVGGQWVLDEEMLEPVDSKTLRMADGTIIGEFNTGGVLPTSEWSKLIFKNGSSIEVLPQKDDTVRGENHFCNGFRGGKIPTPEIKGFAASFLDLSVFSNNGISAKNGGKNSMKFTFYVKEGTRPDKKCNGLIPTMTTTVVDASGKKTTVTCDKADYSERQGVLEAIAQIACGGNFDKEYDKAVKKNKLIELHDRTCTYCGKVFDTAEELKEHEAWHVERKKARRERYLLRKRAKEIAFEEQAQKMAKEIMGEQK